jgi:uncharacterized sodium:solute symporter family permease YidK
VASTYNALLVAKNMIFMKDYYNGISKEEAENRISFMLKNA